MTTWDVFMSGREKGVGGVHVDKDGFSSTSNPKNREDK